MISLIVSLAVLGYIAFCFSLILLPTPLNQVINVVFITAAVAVIILRILGMGVPF